MRVWVAVLAAMVATLTPMAGFGQASVKGNALKPDFSQVKSVAVARALADEGKLVKVLAFPSELGGPDVPENIVYITPEAAYAREMIIGTLRRFADKGLIDKLDVRPEYKGDSVVPSRIVINATSSKKGGAFVPTIEVW
jgi:hypothetical protein